MNLFFYSKIITSFLIVVTSEISSNGQMFISVILLVSESFDVDNLMCDLIAV